MQKQYKCHDCGDPLGEIGCSNKYGGSYCSMTCAKNAEKKLEELSKQPGKVMVVSELPTIEFSYDDDELNKPEHYHKHNIDTIQFLQEGFPPEVLTGFLIGNIIKYTQRFQYKNGEEDLMKVVDYSKRLQDWYKETHSK